MRVDVIDTSLVANRLLDRSTRKRVGMLVAANIVVSSLDTLGILLLVPFLAYLTPGGVQDSFITNIVTSLLGVMSTERMVLVLAALAAALFLTKGALSIALLWIQSGVLNTAQVRLSQRILRSYCAAPWLVQQELGAGSLIRTTVSSALSTTLAVGAGIVLVSEASVFFAVIAALVIVNPALAACALAYLGILGLVYLRILRRPIAARGQQLQSEAERMNSSLVDLVGGIKELTIRGTVGAYVDRFTESARHYLAAYRVISVSNQALRYVLEALMIVGVALVIGVATLTNSTTAVLVSMGVLLAAGFRLLPALNTILTSVNSIRAFDPAVRIVDHDVRRIPAFQGGDAELRSSISAIESAVSGAFSFVDVTFTYPSRSNPALDGLTVQVQPGESLGVVGPSGGGKSTFVDLLLGLLEPTTGEIEIDGAALQTRVDEWRACIGYVPQEIFVCDDSLAANIALGGSGEAVDVERLRSAIQVAHLGDVVERLEHGVNSSLGERGGRLSGGQKQRIGLARALYRGPRILILDEATSALDNETERLVSDALADLHGSLTSVVIAHRLSTVRNCDRILYLEAGRVSGLGTFDELVASHAGFARLVELGSLSDTF
jgi:ABC-type bacteriocin/lantibiotic exporter with double-glycine peptidase domain